MKKLLIGLTLLLFVGCGSPKLPREPYSYVNQKVKWIDGEHVIREGFVIGQCSSNTAKYFVLETDGKSVWKLYPSQYEELPPEYTTIDLR